MIRLGEKRRQQQHRREMVVASCDHLQDHWKSPSDASGLDPCVRLIPGQMQDLDAVREERCAPLSQIETARVQLGEMRDEGRRQFPFTGRKLRKSGQKFMIGRRTRTDDGGDHQLVRIDVIVHNDYILRGQIGAIRRRLIDDRRMDPRQPSADSARPATPAQTPSDGIVRARLRRSIPTSHIYVNIVLVEREDLFPPSAVPGRAEPAQGRQACRHCQPLGGLGVGPAFEFAARTRQPHPCTAPPKAHVLELRRRSGPLTPIHRARRRADGDRT